VTGSARRRPGRLELAAGLAGFALAILVGLDGSPGWQVARASGVVAATGLLFAALARSSARWRGQLAALAGIPAIAIAAGFAPHWAKSGPIPVQAAALLLSVASVTLVIGGTAVGTRGRRRWRRAATSAAVAVATGMAAFVAGPAVAATNVPRIQIEATPDSVGLEYTDVTLRTSDAVELAAWYVESSNRAAVVLLHGAGSTRSNVLEAAAVLADAGFGVLMVDARGHGDSSGRAMDFGWHGDEDVAAATTYLAGRLDVDRSRIGAVGMSMGGEEAIGASGANQLLRAVVAEGASARNAEDEGWLSEEFGARGTLQRRIELVQDWITDVLTSASVPMSLRDAVVASGDTRYLLITAGDERMEADSAAYIAAGARDRVEIWTVSGADHTGGLATAPEAWRDRVVGFLTESLLGAG